MSTIPILRLFIYIPILVITIAQADFAQPDGWIRRRNRMITIRRIQPIQSTDIIFSEVTNPRQRLLQRLAKANVRDAELIKTPKAVTPDLLEKSEIKRKESRTDIESKLNAIQSDEQNPVLVYPVLRDNTAVPATSTTTTTPTSTTTDSAWTQKQNRINARHRKLGVLARSINFPYTRRNFHRMVFADTQTQLISETVRKLVKERLRLIAVKDDDKMTTSTSRPRASGILLSNVPEQLPIKTEHGWSDENNNEVLDTYPVNLPFQLSTPPADYHFRKVTPLTKFKLPEKLRRRPRLRIRRPNDTKAMHGEQTSSAVRPLELPQLAPIDDQQTAIFDYGPSTSGAIEIPQELVEPKLKTSPSSPPNEVDSAQSFGGSGLIPDEKQPELPEFFNQAGLSVIGSNEISAPETSSAGGDQLTTTVQPTTPSTTPPPPPTTTKAIVIPQNSGLRPAVPPEQFQGGFGSAIRPSSSALAGSFGSSAAQPPADSQKGETIFTGDSALTPNRFGPTGDGFGPPILPGAAIPPPVPAVNIGGAAAGILPYPEFRTTHNPPTTIKPSALLNVLNKADIGFNQAISHFERGTPVEAAAIDILEVALGSEKLDSQAKLLGHIDRTIGIDNLQRLQRWANTGGALDTLKEQFLKIAKNYSPPENLFPTVPPQFQYLFAPNGKR